MEAGPSSASTVEAPSRARTSEICNACSDAYRALEVAGQRPPCRRPNGLHKELPGGVVMSNASLIPRAKMNIRTASIDKELPGRVGTMEQAGGAEGAYFDASAPPEAAALGERASSALLDSKAHRSWPRGSKLGKSRTEGESPVQSLSP